jgi:intergrase/recombinase
MSKLNNYLKTVQNSITEDFDRDYDQDSDTYYLSGDAWDAVDKAIRKIYTKALSQQIYLAATKALKAFCKKNNISENEVIENIRQYLHEADQDDLGICDLYFLDRL